MPPRDREVMPVRCDACNGQSCRQCDWRGEYLITVRLDDLLPAELDS